jgi:hypothetical protein
MPVNQKTGKTDQCIPNAEAILKFHIKQLKDQKEQPVHGCQGVQVVSSTSAPHSPAPITAAEAPTPSLAITSTASSSPSSISTPATAAWDLDTSQDPSVHSVAPTLAAKPSTVAVPGPSRHAVPSLILPNITPEWQHGPLILLPPRRQSLHLQRSNAESSQASTSVDGNLESRILSLEKRMDVMERWKLEDEEQKHQMDESLRKAGTK